MNFSIPILKELYTGRAPVGLCDNLASIQGTNCWQNGDMFLKRHVVRKDQKEHIYYSVCESVRVSGKRTVQRRLLNLGELNTTQIERWQRSIEVVQQEGGSRQQQEGGSRQYRLFTDREGAAPADAPDVCEVVLSSLSVRHPCQFGACWLGSQLWQELKLDEFFTEALQDRRGGVEWTKVIELLTVNRLCDPQSELGIHQRWFGTSAMDVILGTDDAVAAKDRLYRALDKAIEHKEALESHLDRRWRDLFGANCELLLYDLTSTYFEGHAGEVTLAAHGYSRDHRGDARRLILALVVTEEGFPLSYEVFEGNRADVTTLEEILESVERKHGSLGLRPRVGQRREPGLTPGARPLLFGSYAQAQPELIRKRTTQGRLDTGCRPARNPGQAGGAGFGTLRLDSQRGTG